MRYQKKLNTKKIVLITIGALIFIGSGFVAYAFLANKDTPSNTPNSADSTIRETNDVDYNGPTSEDISNSQNGKKNSERNEGTYAPPTVVTVGVTYAELTGSNVEIRAFTPSVIEGNGTCTAVLTKNGQTVTGSSQAFIDASSSQCEPIYINVNQFPEKGVWNLKVEYTSTAHKGTSESIEVKL